MNLKESTKEWLRRAPNESLSSFVKPAERWLDLGLARSVCVCVCVRVEEGCEVCMCQV